MLNEKIRLQHAKRAATLFKKAAAKMRVGGIHPDSIATGLMNACIEEQMKHDTPDHVAVWLRDMATMVENDLSEEITFQ